MAVMRLEETNSEEHDHSILSGSLKIIEGYMQRNGHYVGITGGKHDELIDTMRVDHEEELADLLSKHEDECLDFTKRLEKIALQPTTLAKENTRLVEQAENYRINMAKLRASFDEKTARVWELETANDDLDKKARNAADAEIAAQEDLDALRSVAAKAATLK
ncbi:hypothetical protein GTA08_BOTSDO08985 [Neofusicoccum parvum]|uniref:Uncharacterized protein n=1 Tax=Neofusicoccum parvum TaxID=310453 RepID=A0ACB5SL09_9PEZI|nr:hypothetical protein GTA08_BOTSDO08985 [Neofusicoccum parvum]